MESFSRDNSHLRGADAVQAPGGEEPPPPPRHCPLKQELYPYPGDSATVLLEVPRQFCARLFV